MYQHARYLVSAAAMLTAVAIATPADAQFVPGTPYVLTRESHTYTELPSPTVVTMSATSGQFPVTLPFPFPFYDGTITTVSFGVNGALGFPSGTFISTANALPGSTGRPFGFIAPLWDNHWVQTNPNTLVGWQVEGVAPNRTVTFEWRNITTFAATAVRFSFQVRLYEGPSGRIDIDYGPITGTGGWSATMGMEDLTNGRPILFANSGCTTACTFTDYQANSRVSLVQDPGIELFAVGVAPPAIAFLDVPTPIVAQVRNLHTNPIGPFDIDVFVSSSPDLTNPISIGTAQVTLSGFQVLDVTVPTLSPTSIGSGTYWVGLEVDSGGIITEVFENNNIVRSPEVMRLERGSADLVVDRVTTSADTLSAGDSVDVTTRISNVGGEPATNVDVALMLSTNSFISNQDLTLDTLSVTLAPGESTTVTRTVMIDAGTNSGLYFIGALADPADTLVEISESNNGRATDAGITIAGGALAIVTTALPNAVLVTTYVAALVSVGGDPNDQVWTISQGNLPSGLGIVRSTGELFGRPTMLETQTFTVQLVSAGETATKQLTLTVTDPVEPLTIVTREVATALVGQEYAFPIVVTGGAGTSSISWSAQNLPGGFVVTEQGLLAGTPNVAGTSTITVSVTKGAESDSQDLVLAIRDNANLLIVPTPLPAARVGTDYSAQLSSSGGTQPIIFVTQTGQLPLGMTLTPSGLISGSPQEAGTFRFSIEARDSSSGIPARDVNGFELEVLDDGALMITTQSLDLAVVGQGYEAAVAAEGGLAPYRWDILEGRVPEGLTTITDPITGSFQIRGQPTEAGATNFLLEVSDSQGRRATRALLLRVLLTAPVVVDPPDEGCTCTTYEPNRGLLGLLLLVPLLFVRRRR